MKKFAAILILAAIMTTANVASAQVKLTVSESVRSQYTLDNGNTATNKAVSQTDFFLTLPYRLWVDLWGSTDFHGFVGEVDYGLGWRGEWFDGGIFYYDFSGLFRQDNFGDVVAAHGEIFHRFRLNEQNSLVPFAKFQYVYATSDSDKNSGALTHVGARLATQLSTTLTVNQLIRLTYDSSLFEKDSGLIARYETAINWKVSDRVTLNPAYFKVTIPFAGIRDRGTEYVYGAGLTLSFNLAE